MSDPWTEGVPPRPDRAAPRYEVLTPTWQKPVRVTLLGSRLYVRWKHFDRESRRPYPCPAPGQCPSCQMKLGAYPTGFMAAVDQHSFRRVILQLSDAAMEELDRYGVAGNNLRGLQVMTARRDARKNSKMLLKIGELDPRDNLPEEFDPRPTLELVWGLAASRGIMPHTVGGPHHTQAARELLHGEGR